MPDADMPAPEDQQYKIVEGEFWLAAAPLLVAPGTLHVQRGLLELRRELVPCTTSQQLGGGVTRHTPIADIDAEYRLHGRTMDGEEITIPAAVRGVCEHKVQPEIQEFHVLQWLVGGHVGEADAFTGLHVEWDRKLGDWSGPLEISGIGNVQVATADGQVVVSGVPDLPLSTALRRVLQPFRALLETMTGATVAPLAVRLSTAQGQSVEVHWASSQDLSAPERPEGIFDHTRLRNAHVNRWFDICSETHPILFVAARALNGRGSTLVACRV
jgi:hypothetical protein